VDRAFRFGPPRKGNAAAARSEARAWLMRAAEREPISRVFREPRFLVGDTGGATGARVYAEAEVHARYAGRGALGEYLVHRLRARLRPDG
jgi:hypothetical protein